MRIAIIISAITGLIGGTADLAMSAETAPPPRLAAGLMLSDAGLEPSAAFEFTPVGTHLLIRPEVLVSRGPHVGIGGSVGYYIPWDVLPAHHSLALGGRAVYHNSDHDDDTEIDAAGFYTFPLIKDKPDQHLLECILFLGALDQRHDWEFNIGIGAAYVYQLN